MVIGIDSGMMGCAVHFHSGIIRTATAVPAATVIATAVHVGSIAAIRTLSVA
jgi:hypothetical protein